MQDYKRIVSYIHTYENNEKKKNVGFGKLEARNQMARLSIQVNGQGMLEGRIFSVYLLHIKEYAQGIKLGEARVLQGRINAEFKFGTENIMQSGLSLSQIQGIYLTTEEAPYAVFASSWTDVVILPEKFRAEDSAEEVVSDEELENVIAIVAEDQQGMQPEIEAEAELAIEVGTTPEEHETEAEIEPEQETVRAAVLSAVAESPEMSEDALLTTFMESIGQFDNFGDNEELESIVKEELDFLQKTPWEELCSKYPKVIAFEGTDRPHRMCLKIDLKDLDLIAGGKRELNENIYLIRSYYKHRYLLLIENDRDSEGKSCLLGIPGTYCKNEAHLAKMFNFEDFYPSKVSENANGSFGYWCKEIVL